jgi:Flp pilus assembly protein TadD
MASNIKGNTVRRLLIALSVALAATALYLVAFPAATLAYEGLVACHILFGSIFIVFGIPGLKNLLVKRSPLEQVGWIVLLLGGVVGAVLLFTGTLRQDWPILYTHEVVSAVAVAILLAVWAGNHGWLQRGFSKSTLRVATCLALTAAISWGAWWVRTVPWQRKNTIHNPVLAPASQAQEGGGLNSPFFPSDAETYTGKVVPKDYFLDSATCKSCHADIYNQWESSAHHYSSFNNQWYRQAIVYMQQVDGVQASKVCAGCHDAALFFPGNFNTPIAGRVSTPAAQAGIGCMVCHSIRTVKSTMGNADFVLEYPQLQKLVASKNPIVHRLIDYLIEENPEPHRRTFMRPFERGAQSAEFCASCHKVHLDVADNHYRWLRGFDDYDNWQASGVSGFGARSFYYPPKPLNCEECHMPLTPSQDAGNVNGMVHSHRFVAANTALPFVNKDAVQLKDTEDFLKDKKVSVDIFAISPETPNSVINSNAVGYSTPQLATTFAVGEEAESESPTGASSEPPPAPITAPLNRVQGSVRAGETVRVDVVVRTLAVGHFFPGGTVDAFDCWLELKATDDAGHVLFWSGMVEDNGHGPVDPGAEFYRSLTIDAHGNPNNKRNAWAARATIYAHLIPPGAADTVHFRLHVPKDVRGNIHLQAKLNYRKFSWFYTQFSFAGVSLPTGPHDVTPSYDDRRMVFTGSTCDVSGKVKAIPDPPIVVMASANADLAVLPPNAPEPKPQVALNKADWQRWNDYGIGLLLQGDLKGAEAAFERVTQVDPTNPDGWVNIGRARVLVGNMAGARVVLTKALQLAPNLARAHYFYSRVLRQTGDYDGSIAQLRIVLAQYPDDRVVRNDLGRVLFLQHKYAEAKAQFQQTLAIDPENLEANYSLMLCETGLGHTSEANQYEIRYLRFKADESSQSLTGNYLATHPDDNRERQPIHEHLSVPLPVEIRSSSDEKPGDSHGAHVAALITQSRGMN